MSIKMSLGSPGRWTKFSSVVVEWNREMRSHRVSSGLTVKIATWEVKFGTNVIAESWQSFPRY